MAFLVRIFKAQGLKNNLQLYKNEKDVGINEVEFVYTPPKEKFLAKFKQKFRNWFLGRVVEKIKTPNTVENVAWKSFLGFTGGVLLTYIFFLFFYVGVSMSLKSTTYVCALTGIILCLGLAFSSKVRCYVFLLLPVFFSKQGRQALLAYALFLAFTGPGKNSMHNMGILSDSMACGQEVVKRTLRQIIDMVKAPFRSLKETLMNMTKALNEVIETVKSFVMKIKRIIVTVLNVIKTATTWLGSIVNFCNKKIGTPFQRCMKTFDDAIADCKAKLGIMDFLCHVVHIVKALCYTVKWLDFICLFTEFVSDKVVGVVKKKLREFTLHMKTLFYVSIEFSHSYEFETSASNSTKNVAKTILQKISAKVEKLQVIFSFFGFMFGFLFILVFFRVYYYKYKFLSSDRFDNVYINKYIIELDLKRAEMDKETVLPLELKEKKIYAKPTSLRLIKAEKSRMAESMFLLSLTSFKIISFLVCDYSLFWILMTIYEAGHDSEDEVEKPKFGMRVEGQGVVANFYKNLGKTFQVPENPNTHLNPLHCLPDPVTPDTDRYIQIGFLLVLCWFFTVTEAYGLRLRNVVMSYYYPDRARERAVWLYNHILRSRGSFLRFARRQLRRKYQDDDTVEKVTLKERLFAKFPILGTIFGKNRENACLLCGATETATNPLKRCKTPDCPGKYCLKCFATLENICTICQHPIEYGDLSDISEEIDSSEEEYYGRHKNEVFENYVMLEEVKFMTFQELEFRDRFKDVEANKTIDYVTLRDLYPDKAAFKKRWKEVKLRRLQTLNLDKYCIQNSKYTVYKKVKTKLKDLIAKLKRKKSNSRLSKKTELKRKFVEKIKALKNYKRKRDEIKYKSLPKDEVKLTKSEVFFDGKEDKKIALPQCKADYEKLKNEVKRKIKSLKEKKSVTFKTPEVNEDKSDSANANSNKDLLRDERDKGEESDKNSPEKATFTYYFIQREKDSHFYAAKPPAFDQTSNPSDILVEVDDASSNIIDEYNNRRNSWGFADFNNKL